LPTALSRARALQWRFSDQPIGWVLTSEILRDMERFDEADALLGEAVERFPNDQWVLHGHARLAARRCEWLSALSRWDVMLRRLPHHSAGTVGRAETLLQLDRTDEAECALEAALALEPANPHAQRLLSTLREARPPQENVTRQLRKRNIAAELVERIANPEVFIEITSICNFACTYCVSPMKLRQKKQMSLGTFRRVLEQVAGMTTKPVRLHIDGEPTSHPRFKEMALLVNSYGLPVWLATNGSRLDASFLDIWMDPLISISTSPEELAKRHRKLDFERYIGRLANYARDWSRSRSRQNVFFQVIYYPQENAEADAAYKRCKEAFLVDFCRRADLYETCWEQNPVEEAVYRLARKEHPGGISFVKQSVAIGGLYPEEGKMVARERATAGFCDAPWRQLVVHSDGTLGACCVDLSGGTTFAHADELATTPIRELWQSSPQIVSIRQNFLEGRIERDVCQRCLTQGHVIFPETSL
jgi:organic radical activating enzyme